MSDDETTNTDIADAKAEGALADAVQRAETATDVKQQDTKPSSTSRQASESESKFDATQWAALFGNEDPADVKKRLDHSRTWEKRAKENSAAASEYQKYLDSQKTEQQKLQDAKEAAEQELTDLRSANARLMAAATHNLPPELIELLGTGTEEEIDARAKLLSERLAAAAPAPAPEPERRAPSPTRPVESLTAGAKPATERPTDMDAFIRGLAGRT